LQKEENRISKRVFPARKNLREEVHIRNWASEVKCILAECNLLPWWHSNHCEDGLSPKELKEVVSCCLFRCERERWKTEIMNKPKLRTWLHFFQRTRKIYGEYKVQSTPVFTDHWDTK